MSKTNEKPSQPVPPTTPTNSPLQAYPPRPRRRARLTLEIEADTPDELRRSMARAFSRIGIGCEVWTEVQEKANGDARLVIEEDDELVLGGTTFLDELERWNLLRPAAGEQGTAEPKPAA